MILTLDSDIINE